MTVPLGANPKLDRARMIALLAAALATLYFGWFNHDFSVNALRYAEDVERGIELFHPNHLIPNFLFRAIYLGIQAVGVTGVRAIWIMQCVTAACGIAAAAAIAHIACARAQSWIGLLVGLLFAVGFSAWNFAEEPDVYMLPAAAVAVSLAILLPRAQLSWRAVAALAALAVFAVLTLQQYVFWYPVLLALVARRDLGTARSRRGKLVLFSAGIPLACLTAYVAAGWASDQLHSVRDLTAWFLGYAWDNERGFGTYRAPPAIGARLLGTLLGLGNLVFAYELVLSKIALALAIGTSSLLAWIGWAAVRRLQRERPMLRSDTLLVLTWCVLNLAFATWWESRNIEFLFPVWVGGCVLLALAAPGLDRRALVIAALLVGIVNFAVAFGPQRDFPARYLTVARLAAHEQLTPADVLITEELNSASYLRYFAQVEVTFFPGAISSAMQAAQPLAPARAALDQLVGSGARVYTTELDEHGRLRALARWFAPLGRNGFDGAIDRDIELFYRGLDISEQPVAGVRRVRAGVSPQSR